MDYLGDSEWHISQLEGTIVSSFKQFFEYSEQ